MPDFILIVAQDAHFQTRVMFIYAKDFLEIPKRKEQYEILKNHTIVLNHNGKLVPNVILQDCVKTEQGGWVTRDSPYARAVSELTMLADGLDDDMMHQEDVKWYGKSLLLHNTGYHHIQNYEKYREFKFYRQTKINIIDHFLFLERFEE